VKKKPIKRKAVKKVKRAPTVASLTKKAQVVFNRYIRERDSSNGYFVCIACGSEHPVAKMNAGHYVPVKNSSLLRFNELNVNGECVSCNLFDQFHLVGYRKRLVDKIGADAVSWLDMQARVTHKWSRHELEEIIKTYGKR
jgi:hypothetical protein